MTKASNISPFKNIPGQLSMYDLLGDPDDARWLNTAKDVAQLSLDPSTKTGAVLVCNGDVVATGFNAFPRRLATTTDRLEDREQRLRYTMHAEVCCLLYAGGIPGTLYMYPFPPCAECAKLAIFCGVRRVVAPHPTEEQVVRWGDSFKLAEEMLAEAGVPFDLINYQEV